MIELNLLPEEFKTKRKFNKKQPVAGFDIKYALYLIPAILAIFICVHIYLFALGMIKAAKLSSLEKKWKNSEAQRANLETFNKEYALISEDAKTIQLLSDRQINWSKLLNRLSLALPSGIWFNDVLASPKDLTLHAAAISLQKQEMDLIDKLQDNLKKDKDFMEEFSKIELASVQRKSVAGYDIVDFSLVLTLKQK